MNYKIFTIIFLALLCASPVAANVTYSEEYYKDADRANSLIELVNDRYSYDTPILKSIFYELLRQTILMEKQNELQAELVKAQWVETCYAPSYKVSGNYSAWESECANAGYPVG